jgi:hypothetical protein
MFCRCFVIIQLFFSCLNGSAHSEEASIELLSSHGGGENRCRGKLFRFEAVAQVLSRCRYELSKELTAETRLIGPRVIVSLTNRRADLGQLLPSAACA